ncbi:hypothetical protein SAMN06297422_10119 [Lachnospiraceae bacterium]|nr:hypothetical protein SAMN06297422_10119 [Lachnospiraceae bacterium]
MKENEININNDQEYFKPKVPEMTYKYTNKPLKLTDIMKQDTIDGLNETQKKWVEKFVKTYNAQKSSFDAFYLAVTFQKMCEALSLSGELSEAEKNNIKLPFKEGDVALNEIYQNITRVAIKKVIGNDGVQGVKKLHHYLGIIKGDTLKRVGENFPAFKEKMKAHLGDDPEFDKKAAYLYTHTSYSECFMNNTLATIKRDEIETLSKDVFPWGVQLMGSIGIDSNTTFKDLADKLNYSQTTKEKIAFKNNSKENDKVFDAYKKRTGVDDIQGICEGMLSDDLESFTSIGWYDEGVGIYKSGLPEKDKQHLENGIIYLDQIQHTENDVTQNWVADLEEAKKNDPTKKNFYELTKEIQAPFVVQSINDDVSILTSGRELNKDREANVEKATVSTELKDMEFVEVSKKSDIYHFENKGLSPNLTFTNKKLENSMTKDDKKWRSDLIKTVNMQDNSFDAFYQSLLFGTRGGYHNGRSMITPEVYASFQPPSKYNAASNMDDVIADDARSKVVGNDGWIGVKRLFNYMGIIRSKCLSDIGKLWEEVREKIPEEDERLRDKKANYICQEPLHRSMEIVKSLNILSMELESWLGYKNIQYKDEAWKAMGIDNKSTVSDYLNVFTQIDRDFFMKKYKTNPEENLYTALRRSTPDYSDKQIDKELKKQFIDKYYMMWINDGEKEYLKHASEKEKKYFRKGQEEAGLVGNTYVSEHDPELKDWIQNEGKILLQEVRDKNAKAAAEEIKAVTTGKKKLDFKSEEYISDALIGEIKNVDYVRGTVKAFEATGTGKSKYNKIGWHTSNSTKYENMLGSLKRYQNAIESGLGGDAMKYKDILVKDCKAYIDGKYSVRSSDFGKERFDLAMVVLMKNISGTEFGELLRDINKKRGAKKKGDEGYVDADYFLNKEKELNKEKLVIKLTDNELSANDIGDFIEEGQIGDEDKYVAKLIEAYNKGDKQPLGNIIARGLKEIKEEIYTSDGFGEALAEKAEKATRMVKILEKDKELMKYAKREGLNEETMNFSKGLRPILDIKISARQCVDEYRKCTAPDQSEKRKDLLVDIIGSRLFDAFMEKSNADDDGPAPNYIFDNFHKKGASDAYREGIKNVIEQMKIHEKEPEKVLENLTDNNKVINLMNEFNTLNENNKLLNNANKNIVNNNINKQKAKQPEVQPKVKKH